MTTGRFGCKIENYIRYCQRLIQEDWDNLMLFTGPEGSGKTTWATQVLTALDPGGFPGPAPGVERIQFTHDGFLKIAAAAPRGAAMLWDEGRLHKRRAMHGTTLDVLDHLQDCRALNHHMGICFPHERQLDSAVKDHRVRHRWHVPRRGLAVLYERHEARLRRGDSSFYWRATGDAFNFKANRGPKWAAYNARKETHMRRSEVNEDKLGFDVEAADAILRDHQL